MIELKLGIHDQNLKGMSVEEYIDNTLDGLIGFFSPIGAKFFTGKIDYPLESVIALSKFNAEDLVLTTKSYYKDRVFTSYIRAVDSEPVYLRKETVEGDIEPFTLIISGCEKAKTIPGISNSVLERICKFGGALDSGL
ncbi:hypothetical protein [Photobacterium alginatilyticum]|uniref:Uncharacterized protein n=1 Tax=Photobacterium alginatilyticum TaxID=1775171 RepID=A0ABW9YRC3_9GAMM|nr:hypothetical protein [Photobacterium alginatilyticum]NBI56345.1 hypothetical protein [Photobacterium alginatilyticum]